MSLLDEDLIGSFSQRFSGFIRESSIAKFNKIMVEGSIGVLWRADGHIGEVKFVDRVGGDRGGNGFFLPLPIRLVDQDSCTDEPKADNQKPQSLC